MLRKEQLTIMVNMCIRVYFKNGKFIDLNPERPFFTVSMFNSVVESAKKGQHLPTEFIERFPAIDEVYQGFMSENNIAGMILYEDMKSIGKLVFHRLYFDETEGRRQVKSDHPTNMWLEIKTGPPHFYNEEDRFAIFNHETMHKHVWQEEEMWEYPHHSHVHYAVDNSGNLDPELIDSAREMIEEMEIRNIHTDTPLLVELAEQLSADNPHNHDDKVLVFADGMTTIREQVTIDATQEFAPFKRPTINGDD